MGSKLLNKSLIFALIFIGALFFYYYLTWTAEIQALRDQHLEQLEKEKEVRRQEIDSLKNIKQKEADALLAEINSLSEYSNNLVRKIKRYEKRPDFDIDFLTAADIISRSNYQPSE